MKEAPPPENLPSHETLSEYDQMRQQEEESAGLSLVADPGRDLEAQHRAEAIVNGDAVTVEAAYKASLQSGSDYNERMQAGIARAAGTPGAEAKKEDDPVGDAIEAEAKVIQELTKPIETTLTPSIHETLARQAEAASHPVESGDPMQSSWNAMQVAKGIRVDIPESQKRERIDPTVTTEAQKNLMSDFAARNAFEADYRRRMSLNPLTRVGNVVGSVAGKVGDKLAEWGGQIEAGELERAERERLAKRTPSEVMADRAETYQRWSQPQASTESVRPSTRSESVASAPSASPEKRSPVSEIPKTVVSGKKGSKAEEYTDTRSFEGLDDLEELKLRAEALEFDRARLRLEQERIRLSEQELVLRRKEQALAVRLKKMAQKSPGVIRGA